MSSASPEVSLWNSDTVTKDKLSKACIDISTTYQEGMKLVFIATRGASLIKDVIIDDVKLKQECPSKS